MRVILLHRVSDTLGSQQESVGSQKLRVGTTVCVYVQGPRRGAGFLWLDACIQGKCHQGSYEVTLVSYTTDVVTCIN
jgi:hypothetical protein